METRDRGNAATKIDNLTIGLIKKQIKKYLFYAVFPKFWPLDGRTQRIWPQIRIPRQKSFPEPAGKLENPESRSKSTDFVCFIVFFEIRSWD